MKALSTIAVFLFAPGIFAAEYLPSESEIVLQSDLVIEKGYRSLEFKIGEFDWTCYLNFRKQKKKVTVPAGTSFSIKKSSYSSNSGYDDGCTWDPDWEYYECRGAYSWKTASIGMTFEKNSHLKSIICSSYASTYLGRGRDYDEFKEYLTYAEVESIFGNHIEIKPGRKGGFD